MTIVGFAIQALAFVCVVWMPRNNPLNRFDPDGKVDRRTDAERQMTDSAPVLIATHQAVTANAQVEYGFSVNRLANGRLFTSEVRTDNDPDQVGVPIIAEGSNSASTIAMFHTHIAGGQTYKRRDGRIFSPRD